MLSAFTRDLSDHKRPLREALAERPDQGLRLRLQPTILRRVDGMAVYRAWRGVCWTSSLGSVREATAFCEALRAFFHALNEHTPEQVGAQLRLLSRAGNEHPGNKERSA